MFRFSADGTRKKTGEKKKKCPQLCILEIPMTFASQPAKQSTCSINRLPLLQLAGRKLTKTLCFLSRGKLLCAPGSHLALQHQPRTFHSFLRFARQHEEGKRQGWRPCEARGCTGQPAGPGNVVLAAPPQSFQELPVPHPGPNRGQLLFFLDGTGATPLDVNPLCKAEGGSVEVCPSQGSSS